MSEGGKPLFLVRKVAAAQVAEGKSRRQNAFLSLGRSPGGGPSLCVPPSVRLGGPAAYRSYAIVKRIETLTAFMPLEGLQVLDLGCGNGCYTEELARRASRIVGVDAQLDNLRDFESRIPRLVGLGEALPFFDESFDAITMIEVLEHTRDDAAVLRECFRVLRPGGRLALFVPNKLYPLESHPCHMGRVRIGRNIPFFSWLPEFAHRRICHARIYSRGRLLALTRKAGFEAMHLGYIYPPVDSFPLPPMLIRLYRQASWTLERTFLRIFGVSIFGVFSKRSN